MFYINELDYGLYILDMLCIDFLINCFEVLVEIYCMMCFGELLMKDVVEILFDNLFFFDECYDLFFVGCMKFNCCFGCEEFIGVGILDKEDIIFVMKQLIMICDGKDEVDDIDYLGNCCICFVGEMVEN